MAVYHVDPEPRAQRRYMTRVPVINGQIQADGQIELEAWQLWDDRGRPVSGTITASGAIEISEPTGRRLYWSGWVTG